MLRTLRITLEFFAAFAGVLIVIGLILIWRLSANPLSSVELTPYIESAASYILPGTHLRIAHTLLTWDNKDYAFGLHADGIEVRNTKELVIATVPDLDARLNLFGVLIGHFMPRTLIVAHPQIRMERAADGNLYFGELSTESKNDSDAREVLKHIAYRLSHAYFLNKLNVSDTVIDVYNGAGKKQWSVHIPDVTLERQNGSLSGHIDINLSQKDKVSTLELHYEYDRAKTLHRLTTNFDNLNPSLLAGGNPSVVGLGAASMFDLPLTGDASAAMNNDLVVQSAALKIHGGAGILHMPDVWDQPRSLNAMDFAAVYDKDRLTVDTGKFDFGGTKMDVSAKGKNALLAPHDMDLEFTVKLTDLPVDQFGNYWPKTIIPDARDWMVANLSKGKFDRAEATFKARLPWSDPSNLDIAEGQGTIAASHTWVKYMDGMPPVEDVGTNATFDLKHMDLQITGGGIGNLKIEPFTISMTGFADPDQYINIPVRLTGPIKDVLTLIDEPPLGYAKAAGLKPTDITGNAEGVVDLHFPLLKTLAMKDVGIAATMNLTDVASDKLVKKINITNGTLKLDLTKTGYTVKGPATFNGATLNLVWNEDFNPEAGKPPRQATLTGAIKDNQWKGLGLDWFEGTKGDVAATLQLTQPDAKQTLLNGTLDMGAAEMRMDQLNWHKPAGTPAVLKFSAELPEGKDIAVKSIDLAGPQLRVKGTAALTPELEIDALNLEPMIIGRSNTTLFASRSNGTLRFEAYGPSLDVSGLRGGKDPGHYAPQPKEYRIKVGRLYTSDNGFIADAEGYAIRDAQGWSAISLHGSADNVQKLSLELTPKPNNTRTLSITCPDFGEALKGMGFTDTVKGGELKIYGASTPAAPRVITGTAKIGSFEVQGLPVLVMLLNATSPFGFSDILTGTASFDRLKGDFKWEGDSVELINVNAPGKSVGMNIDGKIDMNSGDAKLHGTLVPFSMFNRILSSIPLIGDVLTGGEGGGVLAVAYNVDGTLADPKISVNPVSLLTPGFLRNIFFGGDDTDTSSDEETAPEPVTPSPKKR